MAYTSKRRGNSNDKYLRLTGLWLSKSNKALFTGRVKPEDIEALIEKFAEAEKADAPIVFSLWENSKKESRKDPDFSLQCFVGDSEEKPRSRRDREEEEEDEAPVRRKKAEREEPEEDEESEDEEPEDREEEEEDDKPACKKSARSTGKPPASAKKSSRKKESW